MKIKGWDLNFFNSGEWQVCDERLKDLEKINRRIGSDGYNPGRRLLFQALRLTPAADVRCVIVGQDPYPTTRHATGVAFSVPADLPVADFPQTLRVLLGEYSSDLAHPIPNNGDLSRWAAQGVLLWNAIPSCVPGRSLSHDWTEWSYLTREIIQVLAKKGIVFALLGQVARRYIGDISASNNHIIITSHPSPRGSVASRTPFIGSRLFSTINDRLNDQSLEPIDWRL